MSQVGQSSYSKVQLTSLIVGLGLGSFLIVNASVFILPEGLTPQSIRMLAVAIVVALWWLTESLPIGATSLLPAVCFPLLSIMPAKVVSGYYMTPIIQLLMGGFILALAVENSGAHRRVALKVLLTLGTSPRRLVLGFGVTAAILSMWISNTATSLVMMPVALAIADRLQLLRGAEGAEEQSKAGGFVIAILLATAYCSSVGGMGTPVGTPPNLIALSALSSWGDEFQLTFLSWMLMSIPVVVLVVPVIYLSLVYIYPRVDNYSDEDAKDVLEDELKALGAWKNSEILSISLFALAAVLWISRPDIKITQDYVISGWASTLGIKNMVHDGTVAMSVVLLGLALPSGQNDKQRLIPWDLISKLPWGLIFLFGGGIAISKGFDQTGVSLFVGQQLAMLAEYSAPLFVIVATTLGTYGTEVMSNTALASILMPILSATAKVSSLDPRPILWAVALSCSCAFMMPAATGPNAIVFGTGKIRIIEMCKAGFFANLFALLIILSVGAVLSVVLFG